MTKKEESQSAAAAPVFTKAQLLASKIFQPVQKDVLSVVLDDDGSYTITKAERLIKETLERKAI